MTVGRVSNFSHSNAGKAQGKGMHHYATGGMARHDDAAQDRKMINAAMKSDEVSDKRMVKSAVRQHETQEHGGKHSKIALACGGKVKRYADGGRIEKRTQEDAEAAVNDQRRRIDILNRFPEVVKRNKAMADLAEGYDNPEGKPTPLTMDNSYKAFKMKQRNESDQNKYATGGAVKPPVKRGRSVPVAPPVPPMGPLQSAMSDNYGNNMKRRMTRA